MKRFWWLGFLALAGCGGNGADQQSPLSMAQNTSVPSTRKAADIDPRPEAKMLTEKAVTVKFDVLKATVAVPDGAVDKPTALTGQIPVDIKDVKDLVPKSLVAFSGPTFAKPVELTLPKPKAKGDLALVEWQEKKWVATDATLDKKKNVFKLTTTHLGTYAVLVKQKEKKGSAKDAAKTPEAAPATPAPTAPAEAAPAKSAEPAKETGGETKPANG
ncbi:hypothetical protein BH11ARM2_BH11ARM2_35820 [soil metagenome]